MKKSELKQLIREVIQEMNIPDWNIEDDNYSYNGKNYSFYAKVSHHLGVKDVEVDELNVFDLDDPANQNDNVKPVTDPNTLRYFDKVAKEKYIEMQHEQGAFDELGRDIEAIRDFHSER